MAHDDRVIVEFFGGCNLAVNVRKIGVHESFHAPIEDLVAVERAARTGSSQGLAWTATSMIRRLIDSFRVNSVAILDVVCGVVTSAR